MISCSESEIKKPENVSSTDSNSTEVAQKTEGDLTPPPDKASISELEEYFTQVNGVPHDWYEHSEEIDKVFIGLFYDKDFSGERELKDGVDYFAMNEDSGLVRYGGNFGDVFAKAVGGPTFPDPDNKEFEDCFGECIGECDDENCGGNSFVCLYCMGACAIHCYGSDWSKPDGGPYYDVVYAYEFGSVDDGEEVRRTIIQDIE